MRAVSGTVLLMLLVVLVTTSPAGAATIVVFVLLGVALDAAEEEVMTEGHPAGYLHNSEQPQPNCQRSEQDDGFLLAEPFHRESGRPTNCS